MTREQAIKELDENIDMLRCYDINEEDSRLMQALKMGIAALKQEPCDDAISRKAVNDIIYHDIGDLDKVRKVKAKVDALPSVQPKPIECDDAISREAVLKVIDGWYEQNRDTENIEDLIILITYMQSVQPSRKGHWIENRKYRHENFSLWACSECTYEVNSAYDLSYFCPNCGADMRGANDSTDIDKQ